MESVYARHCLPWLIDKACSQEVILEQRAKVVPRAQGRVLELGMGSGLNLPYYDTDRVVRLDAVEPSAALRDKAHATAANHPTLPLRLADGVAEALPFDECSFDTVVCTFTLCSVQDPVAALAQVRRVLRPGGQLVYCEHGRAPDPGVARWQRRIEPIWKRLVGGCHLTRPVSASIVAAGLQLEDRHEGYLRDSPRFVGWTEWGVAIRT